MEPITQSFLLALRKSTKLIQRDFAELEMLQSSVRPTYAFCQKTLLKTNDILCTELNKHTYPLLDSDINLNETSYDSAIIVQAIDSMTNFGKSLPFFVSNVAFVKKIENSWQAINLVIDFPAISTTCYVEKGKGAWIEKYSHNEKRGNSRLRVSNCKIFDNAVLATNTKVMEYNGEIRNLGSACYMLMLFAAGKFDGIYLTDISFNNLLAFKLLIQETGGICESHDKALIASNSWLFNEFKQSII